MGKGKLGDREIEEKGNCRKRKFGKEKCEKGENMKKGKGEIGKWRIGESEIRKKGNWGKEVGKEKGNWEKGK